MASSCRRSLRTKTTRPANTATSRSANDDATPAAQESIEDDDCCPICTLLLFQPVTTTCGHTMCKSCMAQWAEVSVNTNMKIVDVDEEPVEFDAVAGLEANCPMCRQKSTAQLDDNRAKDLLSKYPSTTRERQAEEHDTKASEGSIQTITVYIGNRHTMIESDTANKHEWTFFVKPSRTDIVEEVQIHLHPTFNPRKIVRQRPPYEIRRLGWGTFALTGYVILKAGYSWVSAEAEDSPDGAEKGMLPLEWYLDFEGFGGKGSMGRLKLKVKNDRNWCSDDEEGDDEDDREWQRTLRQYQRDGRWEPGNRSTRSTRSGTGRR